MLPNVCLLYLLVVPILRLHGTYCNVPVIHGIIGYHGVRCYASQTGTGLALDLAQGMQPQSLEESMRNPDTATSGTLRLLEAIIESSKPLRLTASDAKAQAEAKRLDEKAMATTGIPLAECRKHWTQQARFRWNGRKNAPRKGRIRNKVEERTLWKLDRH